MSFSAKNEMIGLSESSQTYFKVHRVDENIRSPLWHIDQVDRPYTVFWYVISGKKKIKINNVDYIAEENDLVVFPSQIPFELLKSEGMPEMHHIEIAIENRLGPFNLMNLFKFPAITKISDDQKIQHILSLWRTLRSKWESAKATSLSPKYGTLKIGLDQTIELLSFNALTIDWFVEILTLLRPHAAELFPTFDSRLQYLFHFINDHISEKLTLGRLANEVYLSESHVSLLFRQNVNMSPMEYVRSVKLKKARELLLTTDLPLKEVAERIGFDDQSQLSRAFRQAVGVSPSEYRKNSDFI